MKTFKTNTKLRKTKKKYILKGGLGAGKTTSDEIVKLTYNSKEVNCQNCSSNNYTEVIGSLGKSKARTIMGDMIFGDNMKNIDNTSIISYFCNTCGLCKMIRNVDLKIVATKIL